MPSGPLTAGSARGRVRAGDESPEGKLTDGILDQLDKFEQAKIAGCARSASIFFSNCVPTWRLSHLSAVLVYWRATPTDLLPFFEKLVSSTISTR